MVEMFNNINLMKTAYVSEKAGAEGIVMLKNKDNVLPLKNGTRVSVFGRCQIDYNQGGTGSGGSVNAQYVKNILDSLRRKHKLEINEELASTYENWVTENPISSGYMMWATRPLCQKEMIITRDMAKEASEKSDVALMVIGRTAGEEQDNSDLEGSYRLNSSEEQMLQNVSREFNNTVVLLNVSNIIDMSWVEKYDISSVLYVWQGGQEGGKGVADIICGDKCPSGRLTDTIARKYSDYPSSKNFGGKLENIYTEDIYIGYRYFETFETGRVLYPFGYGLSYTDFSIVCVDNRVTHENSTLEIEVLVKNIGRCAGKEVVQVYFSPPVGKINKPSIQLCGFEKTKLLLPHESQKIKFSIPLASLASYDDLGITCSDNKFCYVLERGEYKFFIGKNVRDENFCSVSYCLDKTCVTKRCVSAVAPNVQFKRMVPKVGVPGYEYRNAPTAEYDIKNRINNNLPESITLTNDKGYKLSDVSNGSVTLDEFVAQLSETDLSCLVRGEGMGSKKVRPGTGTAFGGISQRLFDFGIPIAAGTDGPSGLRFDNGDCATSIPIGTMLACTWNKNLVADVYEAIGSEMNANGIDLLLGPGINIHRNPLCGRNFEYYSEDPYISGMMGAAALNGLSKKGVMGTLKHLAANNQETKRKRVNSVVSERAFREIYIKPLEYAMEFSKPMAVMTAYNPVNGQWCASNYDIATTIIRNEFGFKGMIMTDWWAKMNDYDSQDSSSTNSAAMIRSGNDIYMVANNPEHNSGNDNTLKSLSNGNLTLGELQQAAKNICSLLMTLPCMEREPLEYGKLNFMQKIKRKIIWWKC